MAKPQFYRPPPTWQMWAAFGGALVIMSISVVLAGIHPEEPPPWTFLRSPKRSARFWKRNQLHRNQRHHRKSPTFHRRLRRRKLCPSFEEKPTPPPQFKPHAKPQQPIRRSQCRRCGTVIDFRGKVAAVFSPRPEYPYEARRENRQAAVSVS